MVFLIQIVPIPMNLMPMATFWFGDVIMQVIQDQIQIQLL